MACQKACLSARIQRIRLFWKLSVLPLVLNLEPQTQMLDYAEAVSHLRRGQLRDDHVQE